MQISDIKIRKFNPDGKMRAVLSATFDNEFVVHDIKVIQSQDKLFVAMPNRKDDKNEYKDIAHPINSAMREKLQTAILEVYNKELAKQQA